MAVIDILDEGEAYLWAILSDPSGLDQAEFCVTNEEEDDGCFRAWPFQWAWWRCEAAKQIDQGSRSSGKSLSVRFRSLAFPFIHPGQEMVLTAPEGNHLDALTDNVETMFFNNRLPKEMLAQGRGGIKHRPFLINFNNGARIMGRIPQRDGKGVKGCVVKGTPVLTSRGYVLVEDLRLGDLVMTHKNRWRPILQLEEDENDCYRVEGIASAPLDVSCDHRFYGASDVSKRPGISKKDFSDGLTFCDVENLIEDHFYWASPISFPHVDVHYPAVEFNVKTPEFWWLVGAYLADGYLSSDRDVFFRGANDLMCSQIPIMLAACGMKPWSSSKTTWGVESNALNDWLSSLFGLRAAKRFLPAFCFSMEEEFRKALLEGFLSANGYFSEEKTRWEVDTEGKLFAVSLQALAQSLGLRVNSKVKAGRTQTNKSDFWRVYISKSGYSVDVDDVSLNKVKSVTPIGKQKVYNPIVEEDHSYVTGSIISHNIHPIWLELDEGQDYPKPGWDEIIETVKRGKIANQWRAHGVTRGVRDKFYEYTQPDSGWVVHHFPAMYRPTWTDEERNEKIKLYGHRDSPDFRRNVYGLHGDASSALFVLHRLMECVDDDRSSEFNLDEYWNISIDEADVRDVSTILAFIDPPAMHKSKYKIFWIGMDVGFTLAPSSICIFAEIRDSKTTSKLKLIGKVMLRRVSNPDQAKVIISLIDHYRPVAFAMDSTGVGLPLFQDVQGLSRNDPSFKFVLDKIKGYNFSEKLPVELDDTIEIDESDPRGYEAAIIKRNVLEYASDCLRGLVDEGRLLLPWDEDLIGEFRGQTWTYQNATMDMYGRRKSYSQGSFHSLDACRMAVLGWKQSAIEEFLKEKAAGPTEVETIILDW